jgi:AraC-like DNA-binding protein
MASAVLAPGETPVERRAFATRDVDDGAAAISRVYAATRFGPRPHGQTFDLRLVGATAGELSSNLVRYGVDGRIDADPVSSFVTICTHEGWGSFGRPGGNDRVLAPGGIWRADTDAGLSAGFGQRSTFSALAIPLSAVDDAASAAGPSAVRFLDNMAVNDAAEQYWCGLMRLAHRALMEPDSSMRSPVARAHLISLLASAALMTFPNTVMTAAHLVGPGAVGPATVRRAAAYLEVHASEPVTMADVASAAGIGVRALQHGFARHHGTTPMAYLRVVRLERAHRELSAADPATGVTVQAIATRCGLPHTGRFGAAYRATYGTSPGATLRS